MRIEGVGCRVRSALAIPACIYQDLQQGDVNLARDMLVDSEISVLRENIGACPRASGLIYPR